MVHFDHKCRHGISAPEELSLIRQGTILPNPPTEHSKSGMIPLKAGFRIQTMRKPVLFSTTGASLAGLGRHKKSRCDQEYGYHRDDYYNRYDNYDRDDGRGPIRAQVSVHHRLPRTTPAAFSRPNATGVKPELPHLQYRIPLNWAGKRTMSNRCNPPAAVRRVSTGPPAELQRLESTLRKLQVRRNFRREPCVSRFRLAKASDLPRSPPATDLHRHDFPVLNCFSETKNTPCTMPALPSIV